MQHQPNQRQPQSSPSTRHCYYVPICKLQLNLIYNPTDCWKMLKPAFNHDNVKACTTTDDVCLLAHTEMQNFVSSAWLYVHNSAVPSCAPVMNVRFCAHTHPHTENIYIHTEGTKNAWSPNSTPCAQNVPTCKRLIFCRLPRNNSKYVASVQCTISFVHSGHNLRSLHLYPAGESPLLKNPSTYESQTSSAIKMCIHM